MLSSLCALTSYSFVRKRKFLSFNLDEAEGGKEKRREREREGGRRREIELNNDGFSIRLNILKV